MMQPFLFLGFICIAVAATDPTLIVIGDSWGAFGWPVLQKVLTNHGSNLTVKSYAIGGTTTSFWADIPDVLNLIVDENPSTEYVWVSLGGNDVVDFMPNCTIYQSIDQCIDILLPKALNNTQIILDPLFKHHPNVKVIQFGYDILNFAKNAFCRTLGFELIHGCYDRADCINQQFVKIQSLYVDEVAKMYDGVTALNLLGSLQSYANVSGASLGHPNLREWSPSDLMMENCIHPTNEVGNGTVAGFEIVFENLWKLYFEPKHA